MSRKRLISFSLIMLILIIGIGVVTAHDNTTQALENATPVNDGKTFEDIQTAIDIADENSTVELEGEYISEGSPINISKSLTLEGKNNATLNANHKSTILNITNGSVIIKNINFINSKSNKTAAITSDGNLTIENCYFKNNTMKFDGKWKITWFENGYSASPPHFNYLGNYGGAIYSASCITVSSSTFEDNTAAAYQYETMNEKDGYDEYLYGGAICSLGRLYVTNSTFITSQIACMENTTIVNSTFRKTKNALKIKSNAKLTDCIFEENERIVYCSAKLLIANSTFKNNTIKTKDSQLIYTYYNSVTFISNSTFESNDGQIIHSFGDVFTNNTRFENNTRANIYAKNVNVLNSTFKNNFAEDTSIIECENITITNSTFENNLEWTVTAGTADINGKTYTGKILLDDSLKRISVLIEVKNTKIIYGSGKNTQIILRLANTNYIIKKYPAEYKIYRNGWQIVPYGNGYCYMKVNNGKASFEMSKYIVNKYTIEFCPAKYIGKKTIAVTVTKANTIIKAPKITVKYKKSKYFKVTVKHKITKKLVKFAYVKIKIDKKVHKVKTDSKGIAKVNTKTLNVGKHHVKISSGDSNYQMSAKSTITVKR